MPRLTKAEVVTHVYDAIEDSEGYEKDELAAVREEAHNYYYNRSEAAPSARGRSELQSSDVADMEEAVLAQMMPAFEGDDICCFDPISEQDVEQARAESNAVSWVVMQQNQGHIELQQAIRNALRIRNGIIKVYLDEKVNTDSMRYEMLTELEFGQLANGAIEDLSGMDNGYTLADHEEERGFHSVTVNSKDTERKICVKAVDPGNFSWERDYDCLDLQDIQFCAERRLLTRTELIEEGYKKSVVNKLGSGTHDTHIDTLARNQHSHFRQWEGATRASDYCEVYECYMRLDVNGDGLAELMRIVVCDRQVLDMYEMQYVPYAAGTCFLQPHRFNGLGLFDKLRYIQDQKTFGLRQWADNLNNANNARVIAQEGMVNMDDVTNSRPGGVVRANAPGAVEPFPFTDVGPSVATFLEYADKMRSERGGASLDMQAAEMQIAGDTAHGVERQMTAKEQLAALMTRTLAESMIRNTWLLVHKALRLFVPDELQFRVSDQDVVVNPGEWAERKNLTVKAGLSLAERSRKVAALTNVVAQQKDNMQTGLYVSPEAVYNAQLDLARAQGLDDPERYYTAPDSQEAQQAAMAQQEQQRQQQEYQQMLLDMQRFIEERKADNEDAKVHEDARQFNQELDFKVWQQRIETELEEAKLAIDLAKEMNSDPGSETGAGDTEERPTAAANG